MRLGTPTTRGTVRYAVRRPSRSAGAAALLVAVALTGCSSASRDAAAPDGGRAATAKSAAKGPAAAKGGTVGAPGSACPLPVVLDYAKSWTPKAITVDPDSEIAVALGVQGGLTAVCEIDAKPAGHIGFLRVWQGEKSDRSPRQVLEAFTAADEAVTGKVAYTTVEAGGLPAAEADYTVENELLEETKRERAFAVSTPDGPVVVHLGGMDTQEHEAMLPAYELARKSLRLG